MTIGSTAPTAVRELDTMLQASSSWTTWVDDSPNESDHSYYGHQDLLGLASGSFPAALIVSESHNPQRYAAGVPGLPGGELRITIYDDDTTIEKMEDRARDVADDLTAQQTGLANLEASAGICSDPVPSERAAGKEIRSIDITITWGLNP